MICHMRRRRPSRFGRGMCSPPSPATSRSPPNPNPRTPGPLPRDALGVVRRRRRSKASDDFSSRAAGRAPHAPRRPTHPPGHPRRRHRSLTRRTPRTPSRRSPRAIRYDHVPPRFLVAARRRDGGGSRKRNAHERLTLTRRSGFCGFPFRSSPRSWRTSTCRGSRSRGALRLPWRGCAWRVVHEHLLQEVDAVVVELRITFPRSWVFHRGNSCQSLNRVTPGHTSSLGVPRA